VTVRRYAAEGFGADKADRYERARPGYPAELAELLRAELAMGPGSRVVDLAAGTGKLTRLLAAAGADVVAVEPVDGMRAVLERELPTVAARAGTAEAIPVDDGWADALTVAQAFHWFDTARALPEMARVLRPGGGLVLVWNERDDTVPWVRRLSALLARRFEAEPEAPYDRRRDYDQIVERSGLFTEVRYRAIRHDHELDAELLVDSILSRSYIATLPADAQAEVADEVRAVVADLPERFWLPYLAETWWCTKR
jgi:ubiquinone/menaquinone biosynthesis C-methylase UbiE